jgi:hypothetical protein
VVSNLHLRGMGVVLVGLALNALVIGVNQGMPVRLPDDATAAQRDAVDESAKHHVERESDHLVVLADIIPIPGGGLTRASFGDLILAVGFVDVVVQLSRPPRRRSARSVTTLLEGVEDGADGDPGGDPDAADPDAADPDAADPAPAPHRAAPPRRADDDLVGARR